MNSMTASQIAPSVAVSQVHEQLKALETEIADNEKLIAAIRSKLEPVLPSASPTALGKCSAQTEEYIVPLAVQIRTMFRAVRDQNVQMREMLSEIQL